MYAELPALPTASELPLMLARLHRTGNDRRQSSFERQSLAREIASLDPRVTRVLDT